MIRRLVVPLGGFGILLVVALMVALMGALPGTQEQASASPSGYCGTGVTGDLKHTYGSVIVAVGKEMGIPEQGWVVAISVALEESGIKVYANDGLGDDLAPDQRDVDRSLELPHDAVGTDHGSVGIFQQQYPWWGTLEDLMDPTASSRKFYDALVEVDGWEEMPVTEAAQAVQRSAYPDAYARWEPEARALVDELEGATCEEGPVAGLDGWFRPAAGEVTSGYGYRWGVLHAGVDIANVRGTPIYAASVGTVISASCTSTRCDIDGSLDMGGYGNMVDIDHGDGTVTRYAHLTDYVVQSGDRVDGGQLIGHMGTTGNSTGVHLHYEVRINGSPIDPVPFMAERGVIL